MKDNIYYAIVNREDRIHEETIRLTKELSIISFSSSLGAKGILSVHKKIWKDAQKQGYKCVKVIIGVIKK